MVKNKRYSVRTMEYERLNGSSGVAEGIWDSKLERFAPNYTDINMDVLAPRPQDWRKARPIKKEKPKEIKLRPCLKKFAEQMELRLRQFDKTKGKFGWRKLSYSTLMDYIEKGLGMVDDMIFDQDLVDAANYVMMLDDWEHFGKNESNESTFWKNHEN